MKKLVLLTISIVLTNYGCEKQEMYNKLHGNWKIFSISGSIMGFQSVRNFDGITLSHSGKYIVNYNDVAIQGGSFKIEKQAPVEYRRIRIDYHIHFSESYNNDPYANFYTEFPMEVYFFGNDTMTLSQSGVSDVFNYHFVRE